MKLSTKPPGEMTIAQRAAKIRRLEVHLRNLRLDQMEAEQRRDDRAYGKQLVAKVRP